MPWRAGEQNIVLAAFQLSTRWGDTNRLSELTNRNLKWGEGVKVEAVAVAVYERDV